ncbi:acid phosphatase [Cognatiluteimonas profundi]|uniref:acid phosphatase n=1 Tax=Cognatiluteimonas profundi TaxID=2594501 RepID=UPI00131C5618|nr:acid phosphatase [Lysobacter profundi]
MSGAPAATRLPRRFYLGQALLLAVSALALSIVFHVTRLDLQLATPYYDPINHTFPWRYAWISKYFVHRYLKYVLLMVGASVWIVALWTRWRRPQSGFLASHRRRWWFVAWCFVAVPIVIGILRRLSPMHCPWEISDFGGYAPYVDLWSAAPAGIRAGHCFPAAFVASGSWLLGFALLWYPEHKWRSAVVGLAALALAFGLGWVQQMRGAHFLSHTLWSLWVSWAVVLLVHRASGAWRETGGPGPG